MIPLLKIELFCSFLYRMTAKMIAYVVFSCTFKSFNFMVCNFKTYIGSSFAHLISINEYRAQEILDPKNTKYIQIQSKY